MRPSNMASKEKESTRMLSNATVHIAMISAEPERGREEGGGRREEVTGLPAEAIEEIVRIGSIESSE